MDNMCLSISLPPALAPSLSVCVWGVAATKTLFMLDARCLIKHIATAGALCVGDGDGGWGHRQQAMTAGGKTVKRVIGLIGLSVNRAGRGSVSHLCETNSNKFRNAAGIQLPTDCGGECVA